MEPKSSVSVRLHNGLLLLVYLAAFYGCTTFKYGAHIAALDVSPRADKPAATTTDPEPEKKLEGPASKSGLDVAAAEMKLVEGDRIDKNNLGNEKAFLKERSIKISEGKEIVIDSLFPRWLADSKTAQKMVSLSLYNYSRFYNLKTRLALKIRDPAEIEFSGQDLVDIVESIVGRSGFFNLRKPEAAGQTMVAALTSALSGERSLFNYRLIYYLAAFVEGKYVDRSGTLYEKPKISASVGNDTIIPFVMVVLDSFFDCFSQVPVFYAAVPGSGTSGMAWKPIVGQEPTFVKFETDILKVEKAKQLVIDECKSGREDCGWEQHSYKAITKREAKAIKLLSEIGGEQSKHISGLLVRSLNDIQIGAVVVAGQISVGDNDTFAKIIEAALGQISRNLVESSFYYLFSREDGDYLEFQEFLEFTDKTFKSLESAKDQSISGVSTHKPQAP